MQRSVRYLTKYKHARNMYKNRVRFVKGPVPFQGKFFFFLSILFFFMVFVSPYGIDHQEEPSSS